MTHLTRQKVPKSWSLPKKGTAYVVNPKSNINLGIPILVALRDILKFTQNRKETKKAINQRFIKLISWATLNEYVDKWIVIINSEHHNTSFAREIKDISFYKNFLIITWESKI